MTTGNGVPKGGVVDLDVLFQVRRVKLNNREITVKPLDGVSYQKLVELTRGGEVKKDEGLLTMYEIAKQCLPEADEGEVMKMSAAQIGALIAVAQSSIGDVESTIPKRKAPGKASARA